jgi:thiamine pyrophosphate-dependent acetolactate synthase large subunit-like protein
VIAVCGDGGFGQYAMELTTAVRHRMPITVVLLDNGQLGKISKEQRAGEWDVWPTGLTNPDFAAFAGLCGARGEAVDRAEGLTGALQRRSPPRGRRSSRSGVTRIWPDAVQPGA